MCEASRINMMLDFDDCEMEAADIFLNSPGSGTSGYISIDDDTNHSLGDFSKSEEMDFGLCPLESLPNQSLTQNGRDFSIRTPLRRCNSLDMRKKLFQSQNTSPYDAECRPARRPTKMRRLRLSGEENAIPEQMPSPAPPSHEQLRIQAAVERLESAELIADGSKTYALPLQQGKHKDLKAVSPSTIAHLICGHYADTVDEYAIIDCRYPYEYEGGHITGAVNMYTYDQINELLEETTKMGPSNKRRVLVFHCEFSSKRGPSLLRFLRSQDRNMNSEHYPKLFYPEIYILEGGYKAYFEQHKNLCEPHAYTPMLHEDYSSDLRHFRTKAKSWTAGEKKRTRCLRF
ncbi:M-phase inducer phosphatase-like isoform X1 [Haliotis rufescens]|uniref:M-phase inducer phosphatase-like isoform X1 n=2 Tax=Haliotis rufescens TaxID=6454 RepID=UPI001EB011A7|nr:M-phase inducer phosphatase-like isoform X1 [Haliotis rufescens]